MSKVTDGSYGSHGVPVGSDWVVGVQASGPAVKELLLSDLRQYTSQNYIPGGRLTLESGVPVSTTNQTAKTTVYYTPFVHHVINLWDGANWAPTEFTETSLALGTLTSARPYDVFAYLSGGALTLELLSWTNGTTRATAVTLQDGRYCKDGDKTRLLLGTFYTTSTTTTEDSVTKRFVSNLYNAVSRRMYKLPGGTQTTTTSAVAEYSNAGALAKLERIVSNPSGQQVVIGLSMIGYSTVADDTCRGYLCLNGTTVTHEAGPGFDLLCGLVGSATRSTVSGSYPVGTGYSYYTTVITRSNGTGTVTASSPLIVGEHTC